MEKNKTKDVFHGILDGIFPNLSNSVERTEEHTKINRTRMAISVLSWLLFLGVISGKVDLLEALKFIQTLFLL